MILNLTSEEIDTSVKSLLAVVYSFAIAATILFAVFWLKFRIWMGTLTGKQMMFMNTALLLLAIIELLNLAEIEFGGVMRLIAWVIITILVFLRVSSMLRGKSSAAYFPPFKGEDMEPESRKKERSDGHGT